MSVKLTKLTVAAAQIVALSIAAVQRSCTCHPDDNPPRPCPRKYALAECRRSALSQEGVKT